MEIAALSILLLCSAIGFFLIFFTTFGTLVILLGAVTFALMTEFTLLGMKPLLIVFGLYVLGEISEYILVVLGVKKFGASNAAVIGAILGGMIGAVLGAMAFGIGVILGTLFGIFLGAFLVELIRKKSFMQSLLAGTGGVLGRVGSVVVKVVIAMFMFSILALEVFSISL